MGNAEFDNVGVFLYSDEEGTGAFDLDGKVPRRTAVRRRNQLMKKQAGISKTKLRRWWAGGWKCLLEGASERIGAAAEGPHGNAGAGYRWPCADQ